MFVQVFTDFTVNELILLRVLLYYIYATKIHFNQISRARVIWTCIDKCKASCT